MILVVTIKVLVLIVTLNHKYNTSTQYKLYSANFYTAYTAFFN